MIMIIPYSTPGCTGVRASMYFVVVYYDICTYVFYCIIYIYIYIQIVCYVYHLYSCLVLDKKESLQACSTGFANDIMIIMLYYNNVIMMILLNNIIIVLNTIHIHTQ